MSFVKTSNRILGGAYLAAVSAPEAILAGTSYSLHFLDLWYQGQVIKGLGFLLISPVIAIGFTLLTLVNAAFTGYSLGGLSVLLKTLGSRLDYYLRHKLFFGWNKYDDPRHLYRSNMNPAGLDTWFGDGFFASLAIKFYSLTTPIETYLANSVNSSDHAHNSMNLITAEKNLALLKKAYEHIVDEQLDDIISLIEYEVRSSTLDPEFKPAALRCIQSMRADKSIPPDINQAVACRALKVLAYVWTAINKEAAHEDAKTALRYKLFKTLYTIQRSNNFVDDGVIAHKEDLPECVTGQIELLLLVLTNEKTYLPGALYTGNVIAQADMYEIFNKTMNLPFESPNSWVQSQAKSHREDPDHYKASQAKYLKRFWRHLYRDLIEDKTVTEEKIDEVIDTGIEHWSPPEPTR